jgi:peptidoglycan/LPS O-acetylase OafA/YrhL
MNAATGIKWLLSKASRNTSTAHFIAEIDGLRFIAISSVFLFHMSEYVIDKTGRIVNSDLLALFFSKGHIGVQLFFIISGFVIALPYAKGHLFGLQIPKFKQFFTRRLSRLEPPYFINLIILWSLLPLVTENKYFDLIPNLLASLLYLHNIVFFSMSKINSVAWSLEIEFQFYILAPILTYVFKIKKLYIRRITILCSILAFSIIQKIIEGLVLPTTLLSFAQFFFTGFLLLDIYLNDWQQSPTKNYIWDILSVIAWVCVFAILYMAKSLEAFIVIPMFIAYCAAFKGKVSNRLFCHPLIYTIGGMCYTIYLYHYTLISAIGRFIIKIGILNQLPIWQSLLLSVIILAPITIFICTLLFVLIEKPCMKKGWYIQYSNMRDFKIFNH